MEFVWKLVVVNVADLASCYSDAKSCFGKEYNNIFLTLGRILWSIFYNIAWNIWCGPPVIWCPLLALSFRHIVSNFKLSLWSVILVWALFFQSSKPWNFDSDRLKRRNYFILDDLSQGWAIFLAQVAFFSLTQAPKKLHQVIFHVSDYVGSNLDLEISFPDVWVECNLPASIDSLSDRETKRLIKEEAEAREQRREARRSATKSEQGTFKMSQGKILELVQPYPLWIIKPATKHGWSVSSKTARLQSRFGFPTRQDASTQTEDPICERRINKKDDAEAFKTFLDEIEGYAVSDTPRSVEIVEFEIQGKSLNVEERTDEIQEISTGIRWNVSTGSMRGDEQIQEGAFPCEELGAVLEIVSSARPSLEATQVGAKVTEENASDTDTDTDTDTSVDEPSPDFQEAVPCDDYRDIEQDVQFDNQQGISHEEPDRNTVPDTHIDPNTFDTGALEASETQDMTKIPLSDGLKGICHIDLKHEPEVSEHMPIFRTADFGVSDLTPQTTENAPPVFIQVDQENSGATNAENGTDLDLDGDEDMSFFEDLYSDDRSEDEHPKIGEVELNTRLLAAIELSSTPQDISQEIDNAMVSEPVEIVSLLYGETDLESNSTEIETDDLPSSTDVNMGFGSETNKIAIGPQEIQMRGSVGEVNIPIFGQYWNMQTEPQQSTEVEMSEASNHSGPFPESAAREVVNQMDELESELWLQLLKIEEQEEDEGQAHDAGSPREETELWALPPELSFPRFLEYIAPQDDASNNEPSPVPSDQLGGHNIDQVGNYLESQSVEEPIINTEEEIVARPKLVPRSRRARPAQKQPGTQSQAQEQAENLLVGEMSDLAEQNVLSFLGRGFGAPGEGFNAAESSESIVRETQNGAGNLVETPELRDQVQPGTLHNEPNESETCPGDELLEISITEASKDELDPPREENEGSQHQNFLDVPPMQLGALLLPGGNSGILSPPPSSAPDARPGSLTSVSSIDASEEEPTTKVTEIAYSKGKGRAVQEDHVPAINIGGLTLPGGNPIQNVSPSAFPQTGSSSPQSQPTPPESVSDADASEAGSVASALESLRPRSPVNLQQRELERLKKKYTRSGRNLSSIFMTPRRAQAQPSSTPDTPSRTAQKEARSEAETTGELIFLQSPRPALKIASPAAMIKHLKETREGEGDD